MNYIINPMWFYWLGVVDKLLPAMLFIGGCLAVVGVSAALYAAYEAEEMPRWATVCVICGLIILASAIFIPSKETLIEMQVAEQATKENIELTVDTIKGMIDYVAQKVGELSN